MKFSIIIPVYNVEEYLIDCLESVKRQTFEDYEIMLVDDGSCDKSPQICDDYAKNDKRIRVIHKANGGLSSARNIGIENAQGEYLIFLDSDDLITDNALKSISFYVKENVDVVVTELLNVEDPMHYNSPSELFTVPSDVNNSNALEYILNGKPNIQASVQYIVRKDLLKKYNIHFEEGYYHEDNVYTPWMLSHADSYAFFTGVWYIRRYGRPDSITSTRNVKRALDVIEITNKYVCGEYFSHLVPKKEKIVKKTIIGAMWWHLYKYDEYSDEEKKRIINCLQKNKRMFRYSSGYKQVLFCCMCALLGFEGTLTTLAKIKKYGRNN